MHDQSSAPRVERALISVYDKFGLPELGRRLAACGVELISTGGTATALREAGVEVTEVSEVTGFPEILGGRVKTLHPGIHGGILCRGAEDATVMQQQGLKQIQLVAVNLYPFMRAAATPNMSEAEVIEFIDIGGPAMLRAAAKNFAQVAIMTDPAEYPAVLDELEASRCVSLARRRQLAARAFAMVADYDLAVAKYMQPAAPAAGALATGSRS